MRQPTGSTLPTNAPSNAYPCADGKWIIIAGNSDRIFTRLMALIGRPDLAEDKRFQTNWGRVEHAASLDASLAAWTRTMPSSAAQALLEEHSIPATRIYTIEDCANDPHYAARGMVQSVNDPRLGMVLHPGIVPKFDGAAAAIGSPGAPLGADTDQVLVDMCGLDEASIKSLRQSQIV